MFRSGWNPIAGPPLLVTELERRDEAEATEAVCGSLEEETGCLVLGSMMFYVEPTVTASQGVCEARIGRTHIVIGCCPR